MGYYWSIINKQVIKTKEGPIALDTKVGWILSGPVNNPSASANSSVLSHVTEVQSEFMDANNILEETNTNAESDCFSFKNFQKENITFNKNMSHYEFGLPFKEYHKIVKTKNTFYCICIRSRLDIVGTPPPPFKEGKVNFDYLLWRGGNQKN